MKTIIAERLRELRGQTSLREMAEPIGIKYSAWARYEAGGSLPGADILARICCVHACSADWLLGIDNLRASASPNIKTGAHSAVAIGANARATVRGTSAARGESAAPGDAPMCAKCPFKKAAKNFQKIFAK